jgi:hypothetical protein
MTGASEAMIRDLGAAASAAEHGFLAAGQSLEGAVGILDRLARRFAAYIAELTGAALGETHRDLAAAGEHVAALADVRRADAAALEALGTIVTATAHRAAALQPVTHEVEALSLNASVVAGGLGIAGTDFAAFAGSIRNAARHARACLDAAREGFGKVDQEVTAARTATTAFAERHGPAMQSIPARLAGNLRSLAAQQRIAADAATVAHRRSEEIRRQVAEQIVALQLGDITRQRLEHVQFAAQLQATPGRQLGALLAAQLTDAADELAREGERVESGMRRLAEAARAIGELGARVHGDAQHGGFIGDLEADIRHTGALFGELSAGDAETERRMAAVLEAADTLGAQLSRLQSVQEDIRIMGLNATLKCGRLGEIGRPLAVVARELRLCSLRFGASATAVLADLDRLRALAATRRDPSRRDKHAELARAAEELLAPLQRLRQLEQEVASILAQLTQDADEAGRLVAAAVAQFAVRHALAATLRQAAGELASWSGEDTDVSDVLDRVAAGYTMAREREVHVRFAPLPEAPASADLADILF